MENSRNKPRVSSSGPAGSQSGSDSSESRGMGRPEPMGPRFSIGTLLLLTFVVCVAASGGHYLYTQFAPGSSGHFVVLIAVLSAPVVILIVASVLASFLRKRR